MTASFEAVVKVVRLYLDGLHHSDTGRLAETFHPRAHYVCASDGSLLHRAMAEYFPIVDRRPSPASRGERRRDRIRAIEFAGPLTARVSLNCAIGDKYFNDFLTLVLIDGRWQIISKVFHHEPLSGADEADTGG